MDTIYRFGDLIRVDDISLTSGLQNGRFYQVALFLHYYPKTRLIRFMPLFSMTRPLGEEQVVIHWSSRHLTYHTYFNFFRNSEGRFPTAEEISTYVNAIKPIHPSPSYEEHRAINDDFFFFDTYVAEAVEVTPYTQRPIPVEPLSTIFDNYLFFRRPPAGPLIHLP